MLFNDAANCYDYVALVTDESLSGMIPTGESRSTRGNYLSQCHFVYHKSYVHWFGIEPELLRPTMVRCVFWNQEIAYQQIIQTEVAHISQIAGLPPRSIIMLLEMSLKM